MNKFLLDGRGAGPGLSPQYGDLQADLGDRDIPSAITGRRIS
ncbi:hypothetical protein [Rhizobium sp. CIAT894]|nr:hypothetical protein [Rhizobium sp. CIAT894]